VALVERLLITSRVVHNREAGAEVDQELLAHLMRLVIFDLFCRVKKLLVVGSEYVRQDLVKSSVIGPRKSKCLSDSLCISITFSRRFLLIREMHVQHCLSSI